MRCNNKIENGVRSIHCNLDSGHDGECSPNRPPSGLDKLDNAIRYLSMRINGWGILIDFDAIVIMVNLRRQILKGLYQQRQGEIVNRVQ